MYAWETSMYVQLLKWLIMLNQRKEYYATVDEMSSESVR